METYIVYSSVSSNSMYRDFHKPQLQLILGKLYDTYNDLIV